MADSVFDKIISFAQKTFGWLGIGMLAFIVATSTAADSFAQTKKTNPASKKTSASKDQKNQTGTNKPTANKVIPVANKDDNKPSLSRRVMQYSENNNAVGVKVTIGRDNPLIKNEGLKVADDIKKMIEDALSQKKLPHKVEYEFVEGAGIIAKVYTKGKIYINESEKANLSLPGLARSLNQIKIQFDNTPDNPPKAAASQTMPSLRKE